jgi:hypothetical protein
MRQPRVAAKGRDDGVAESKTTRQTDLRQQKCEAVKAPKQEMTSGLIYL